MEENGLTKDDAATVEDISEGVVNDKYISPKVYKDYSAQGLPVGTIVQAASNPDPDYYRLCDGSYIDVETHRDLWNAIGFTYGWNTETIFSSIAINDIMTNPVNEDELYVASSGTLYKVNIKTKDRSSIVTLKTGGYESNSKLIMVGSTPYFINAQAESGGIKIQYYNIFTNNRYTISDVTTRIATDIAIVHAFFVSGSTVCLGINWNNKSNTSNGSGSILLLVNLADSTSSRPIGDAYNATGTSSIGESLLEINNGYRFGYKDRFCRGDRIYYPDGSYKSYDSDSIEKVMAENIISNRPSMTSIFEKHGYGMTASTNFSTWYYDATYGLGDSGKYFYHLQLYNPQIHLLIDDGQLHKHSICIKDVENPSGRITTSKPSNNYPSYASQSLGFRPFKNNMYIGIDNLYYGHGSGKIIKIDRSCINRDRVDDIYNYESRPGKPVPTYGLSTFNTKYVNIRECVPDNIYPNINTLYIIHEIRLPSMIDCYIKVK